MGIKAKFNINEIFKDIEERIRPMIRQAVMEAFQMACMEVVNNAKSLNTYQDQTNQLRSSIGYQIYDQGVLITEYFQSDGKGDGTGGAHGVMRGKNVAEEAARQYPEDIVGVVVAGADYALYVESKGYDVLSGSSSQLSEITNKYLRIAAEGLRG